MKFTDLNLIPSILKALKDKGYESPTPIQAQAIPAILEGRDVLGCAQTGTGKTAAFSIPMLQYLSRDLPPKGQKRDVRALVVTPTRELAIQIEENIEAYAKGLPLRQAVIFGGVKPFGQIRTLRPGVDILVATPGRLLDLMNQGYVRLDKIEIFCLDEADRMLDMGFIHDVKKIIAALPKRKQSLFFSATMEPPIMALADTLLHEPIKVEVAPQSTTAEKVKQRLFQVEKTQKRALLTHLFTDGGVDSAIVFTRTKHGADRVTKHLNAKNISAQAIHGNKSQNARQNALKNFKDKKTRVLVATDIAARGIDIDALSHVINFEIPNEAPTYVHRIGRTGRAERSGEALSLCDAEETAYVKSIQRLIKQDIPVDIDHPFHVEHEVAKPKTSSMSRPRSGRNRSGFRRGRR